MRSESWGPLGHREDCIEGVPWGGGRVRWRGHVDGCVGFVPVSFLKVDLYLSVSAMLGLCCCTRLPHLGRAGLPWSCGAQALLAEWRDSRLFQALPRAGDGCPGPHSLQAAEPGSRVPVAAACGLHGAGPRPRRSAAGGLFLDQGSNQCSLPWQVDSASPGEPCRSM